MKRVRRDTLVELFAPISAIRFSKGLTKFLLFSSPLSPKHSFILTLFSVSLSLSLSLSRCAGPTWATHTSPTDRTATCCWRTAGRSPTSSPTWWRPWETSPCSCSPTTRSPCWRAWCTRTKVGTKRVCVCVCLCVYRPVFALQHVLTLFDTSCSVTVAPAMFSARGADGFR